ncbi:MAG: DNA-binding protein [Pseudomonadota bacterium]
MSAEIASKEKVFAAADLLASTGEKITLEKLRVALGGGSLSTIRAHLSQWREVQASSKPVPPVAEPAPAALSERMTVFLSSAWSDAMAMANARLDGERSALAGARGVLEDERREALEAGDALATELDAANTMLTQFAADAKTSTAELARLRQRIAKSEAETMATAAAKDELSGMLATVSRDQLTTQAEVARLTGELTAARGQIEQLSAIAKTSSDEATTLRQQFAQSHAEHMAATAAKNELAGVLAMARADHKASQADVARLTGELATAQAREAAEARNAAAADKRATEANAKANRAPDDSGKSV